MDLLNKPNREGLKVLGIGNIILDTKDTNIANETGREIFINQLNYWNDNNVINIMKTSEIICQNCSGYSNDKDEISRIIFCKAHSELDKNEEKDVDILYYAIKWSCILVANDGMFNSQTIDILRSRKNLYKKFRLEIYKDYEMVNHIFDILITNSINVKADDKNNSEKHWFDTVFDVSKLINKQGNLPKEIDLDCILNKKNYKKHIVGHEINPNNVIEFEYENL